MGTTLHQGATRFRIRAADKAAALAAVRALAGRRDLMGGGSSEPHFSWVATEAFRDAATLEEALGAWRWEAQADARGDVVGLAFEGEKLGDEDVLFDALAPFVEAGCFVEADADGEAFRWRFDGRRCHTDSGRLVYEGDPAEGGPTPSAEQALRNIHAILYADGPDTPWDADTLDAVAAEVARLIPRPE